MNLGRGIYYIVTPSLSIFFQAFKKIQDTKTQYKYLSNDSFCSVEKKRIYKHLKEALKYNAQWCNCP